MEVYVLTLLVAAYHSGELFRIIGLQFSVINRTEKNYSSLAGMEL